MAKLVAMLEDDGSSRPTWTGRAGRRIGSTRMVSGPGTCSPRARAPNTSPPFRQRSCLHRASPLFIGDCSVRCCAPSPSPEGTLMTEHVEHHHAVSYADAIRQY